jgi:hypothetical protein
MAIVAGSVEIEFLPWYQPETAMLRCGGKTGCGALVMSDDAERHLQYHQDLLDLLVYMAQIAGLT